MLRGIPGSLTLKKKKLMERNKVKMKQEVNVEEADKEEPSDLVIDDIMDTTEVKTEPEEPAANTFQSPGLDFLQAQRDLLRPKQESDSTPSPPPGEPSLEPRNILGEFADFALNPRKYSPEPGNPEEPLPSPEEVHSASPQPLNLTMKASPPLMLRDIRHLTTNTRVPDMKTSPALRDIRPVPVTRPASGQHLKRPLPAAGQPVKYLPIPVQTTAPAPVMMIQSPVPLTNGITGPVLLTNGSAGPLQMTNGSAGPLQLTNRSVVPMLQASGGPGPVLLTNNGSLGPLLQANGSVVPRLLTNGAPGHVLPTNGGSSPVLVTNGSAGPRLSTNGITGHVPQANGSAVPMSLTNGISVPVLLTNGGPGHVSHVPSGLIQLVQTPQRTRLTALPGGTSLLRTNMGRLQ